MVEAAAEVEEPAEPPVKLPTAADIEQIHEEARKSGYDAGYEEATARGRMEAMRLFGLVEDMDKALAELDASIAGSVLELAIEIARQLVRKELASQPESALAVVREALQQMPQSHAMVHLHPRTRPWCASTSVSRWRTSATASSRTIRSVAAVACSRPPEAASMRPSRLVGDASSRTSAATANGGDEE